MIKPKKSLGQNFLKDINIVKKILDTTNIFNQNIIEVGPGMGDLTNEILKLKPKHLFLIEKDNNLYEILKKKISNKNVTLINQDIMSYDLNLNTKYKIISNLPYNISSKFLLKILLMNSNITEIVCMIQSELADKFDIKKGNINKYKFVSNYRSNYEIKFKVSPNVFFPKPKIYSKVVSFKLKNNKINEKRFKYFFNNFFINKRKIIKANKFFVYDNKFKYFNHRYEQLNYDQILEIYKKFKFPIM